MVEPVLFYLYSSGRGAWQVFDLKCFTSISVSSEAGTYAKDISLRVGFTEKQTFSQSVGSFVFFCVNENKCIQHVTDIL